jgi:hypothetical protein
MRESYPDNYAPVKNGIFIVNFAAVKIMKVYRYIVIQQNPVN